MGKIPKAISDEKFSMGLVLAIILIVSFAYFNVDGFGNSLMSGSKVDPAIYNGIALKINYDQEGNLKVFATAKNNALARLKTAEGSPIPEETSIVIGAEEAAMMRKEGIFSAVGDNISDFFGISTSVGGVLRMTETPIDYLHFLSADQFKQIKGEEGRMFIKSDESDMGLFFKYTLDGNSPAKLALAEGKLEDYIEHDIVGKKYYPLILGSEEGKMMIEDGSFTAIGDKVQEFGKDFIIVGILADTNSALDDAHIVPLTEQEM